MSSPFEDDSERSHGGGRVAMWILLGVIAVTPALLCGGCFAVGAVLSAINPGQARRQSNPGDNVVIAQKLMYCATDPAYLDQSPNTEPAKFVRVLPGTRLLVVSFGQTTGDMYYTLTSDGKTYIYVYRADYHANFAGEQNAKTD